MNTRQLGVYMGAYSMGFLSGSHYNMSLLPKLFLTLTIFIVLNLLIAWFRSGLAREFIKKALSTWDGEEI